MSVLFNLSKYDFLISEVAALEMKMETFDATSVSINSAKCECVISEVAALEVKRVCLKMACQMSVGSENVYAAPCYLRYTCATCLRVLCPNYNVILFYPQCNTIVCIEFWVRKQMLIIGPWLHFLFRTKTTV